MKRGKADTSGVGFSEGFGEIEGRFLGVLDEVSSLQLLRCSIIERDVMDLSYMVIKLESQSMQELVYEDEAVCTLTFWIAL